MDMLVREGSELTVQLRLTVAAQPTWVLLHRTGASGRIKKTLWISDRQPLDAAEEELGVPSLRVEEMTTG